ncbi:hypothetical protein [Metabacillus fastidiosus]|uniref:hypothetical protein n=1 Tax=Metabacillus fastidiosus TaxID=1458 RepID=UPI002DB5CA1B|nr:hypothetical protein [Metabacillus fastidiosus]MEC2074575.1 hypothetical protein [Metabacillus fastidiosus]
MQLRDHLSSEQKRQLNQLVKAVHTSKQKERDKEDQEEKVNWPEIMGMNRDTYKRKRGAIRRK